MSTNSEHISQSKNAVKPIYSITPFTLIDYPDKTACILWFAGCNMRCLYCYNPDIVLGKGKITFHEALAFIKTRIGLLDAVVLSGGECTLHPNIINLIKEIKQMGMLVKIDTNGSKPNVLKRLVKEGLIDFISLDFKSTKSNYYFTTRSNLFEPFKHSLRFLVQSGIPFEVRTTIHSSLIDQSDIIEMTSFLEANNYNSKYFLQNFVNDVKTVGSIEESKRQFIDITKIGSKLEVVLRN